jgi:hypothetical protein
LWPPGFFRPALKNFADGGARLLAAAQDAGMTKAVVLSIINCDRSGFGYYRSKAAKEQVYERSGLKRWRSGQHNSIRCWRGCSRPA